MEIDELNVGDSHYRFREPMQARYNPDTGRLFVEGFSSVSELLVGIGKTEELALKNLTGRIHEIYQIVCRRQPFDLSGSARRLHDLFTEKIDIGYYLESRPIRCHRLGRIVEAKIGNSRKVEWSDRTTVRVHLDKTPPEFVTYRIGQNFDAFIEYNLSDPENPCRILECNKSKVDYFKPMARAEFWKLVR